MECFINYPAKYVVVGREVGEQDGTPHLQGFIIFFQSKRFTGVKKIHERAHWEVTRGTSFEAAEYCKKQGDYEERGEIPKDTTDVAQAGGQATKAIWDRCYELAKEGQLELIPKDMYLRYYKTFQEISRKHKRPEREEEFVPRPWQAHVLSKLPELDNDRNIAWIYDSVGKVGKSRLCTHLCRNYGAIMLNGKKADMAYTYNGEPMVIFDVPRTETENMNHLYSFAESLKNGMIFSTKYESQQKFFKAPIVIFFANVMYDENCWSKDRVIFFNLDEMLNNIELYFEKKI